MGEADAETFGYTGGTGSLMMQPGSRLTQPCVEEMALGMCRAGSRWGGGSAMAGFLPTIPFCLPALVLFSCPIHVKPTFLMVVVHGSSESLLQGSYKLRDDGVGRGFSEQSVQSFSNSVPEAPGGATRCFPPQACGHPDCDSGLLGLEALQSHLV